MAFVQSLGLREASALPYLIQESILPPSPPPSSYRWTVARARDERGHGSVEEEIVIAGHCVVWSRNGVVKRVLNLSVESEPVLHAFVTDFRAAKQEPTPQRSDASALDPLNDGESQLQDRGLVVVLKTQIHILLFSGDSHVVPLSFEVDAAFPFPYGFILQRTLAEREIGGQPTVPTISHHDLSTINESSLSSIVGTSSRPSLVLPGHDTPRAMPSKAVNMPRTFSFTETMSELGLVVCSPHRKGEPLEECRALPHSEQLVFVSSHDECWDAASSNRPVCTALTFNDATSMFTLWHVTPDGASEANDAENAKSTVKPRASLRKSYGRELGAATPAAARSHLRESFGGLPQRQPDILSYSSQDDQASFPLNDLASQLGPEFGEHGVQTRSARRVSSMMARTDLGAGKDRNTFSELAMGHSGRLSLNRPGKRGESIGSFNDRHSFGFRRRSSFPTNASVMSAGTSFLDMSAGRLLDDFDPLSQSFRVLDESSEGMESNLPKSIGFFKIKSFARRSDAGGTDTSSLSVSILKSPSTTHRDTPGARDIYFCITDKAAEEITIVKVLVKETPRPGTKKPTTASVQLKATEIRKLPGVVDACTVQDAGIERLFVLMQSRSGLPTFQLEAPWSPSFRLDLPPKLAVHDPFSNTHWQSPLKDKDTGSRRTVSSADIQVDGVQSLGSQGHVSVVEKGKRSHTLYLRLAPRDDLVVKILRMCDIVLNMPQHESLLVAFWEVTRWLKTRDAALESEWTALVVVLFSLAVPFISRQGPRSTPGQLRKKTAFLRSSSGSAIDLSNYNSMRDSCLGQGAAAKLQSSTWSWLGQMKSVPTPVSSPTRPRHGRGSSTASFSDTSEPAKHTHMLKWVTLAREYVQTPFGENAIGPEGYLPISINSDREKRCNAIGSILLGLHLIYEESKLSTTSPARMKKDTGCLVTVMAQLGQWLGWMDWTCEPGKYYEFEATETLSGVIEGAVIDGLKMPAQPFAPPSVLAFTEDKINGIHSPPFLTIARIAGASETIDMQDPLWRHTGELTPRTLALLIFLNQATNFNHAKAFFDLLHNSTLGKLPVDTIPDGVAAAFHQALASRRNRLLQTDATPSIGNAKSHEGHELLVHASRAPPNHEALRDYHSICASTLETENLQRWDASSEADRHAITRLIFCEDRRLPEASKLVNQTRPPVVECTPEPEWSEVDLLEAQKELAQHVTRRTLSVAAGRGMMHYSSRVPLLTERVPIPAFSLQCIMKPRNASESNQAMTFSADKATFTEEKVCWAFFHNGASMGLMISDEAQGIDTSWILYNKPGELTNRHAGFLLALGLNGHLKTLAKWVAFKYLTPKHTMTSVGLLLGLSASFLGTMDTLITRLLSVHVTRLLPPGAAELNLSPLTQTTGIMGIGLLYHGSSHRRMSEVMLSEIENPDPEEGIASDAVLRDEGYRLAAGFSLGLINLGRGKSLHALHDMAVVERLLTIAVGTKNVNLVHVLDRATAGAVMAIAFIFLKTNDSAIASKIDVPDTLHQFDYVRPDMFLLRTLARHLIMWKSITPTVSFVEQSLPKAYRYRTSLLSTKALATEDLPFLNILTGILFALGLRHAGSQSHVVRDLLVSYLDQFLRISRLPAHTYDARVTLNSVRNCLDALALATSTVMAGSGDLIVMRRLRALHGRTDKNTPFGSHLAAHMALGALFLAGGTRTFGTSDLAIAALCIAFYPSWPNDVLDNSGHLQALRHLWVLAVESRCLVVRDGDTTGSVVGGVQATIHLKDGSRRQIAVPGLIPEFDTIRRIEVRGEGFWEVSLSLEGNEGKILRDRAKKEHAVMVPLRRRAAYDKASTDLFGAELQARAEANGVPSVDPNLAIAGAAAKAGSPFEWLFGLQSLGGFDAAERQLVLGQGDGLSATVVDTRLEMERGVLNDGRENNSMEKDKLWQLRLLFAWFDRWEREDEEIEAASSKKGGDADEVEQELRRMGIAGNLGNPGDTQKRSDDKKWFSEQGGTWLRKEVIERLRYRVWKMAGGDDSDQAIV